MKKRGVAFDTTGGAGKTLAQVLSVYIKAAYPENASECSQATRSSLLQVVDEIVKQDAGHATVTLKKRQLPMIKSAIEWYFLEVQKDMNHVKDALLSRLNYQ